MEVIGRASAAGGIGPRPARSLDVQAEEIRSPGATAENFGVNFVPGRRVGAIAAEAVILENAPLVARTGQGQDA